MNLKTYLVAAALLLQGCGPDWAQCTTCKPDEPSAESVDGTEQIPVVVNVTNVNVTNVTNVNVTQTTTNFGDVTISAGGGNTGTLTCRKVCVRYEEKKHCDQGWHGTDTKGRCTGKQLKCLEEMTQCS
jgi:hypothetical protein